MIQQIRSATTVWFVILFFIGSLAIRLFGLNQMGNVWDEYFYYDAMRDFARNFARAEFAADQWRSNFEHPPLGKYVYIPSILWNKAKQVNGRDAYHAPRVISTLLGSLTIIVIFLLGQRFFSLRVGVAAATTYALLPPVIAYHQIINLDVTMVLLFTLGMYFFLDWIKNEHLKQLWWAIIFGSLAIATKFNALLIAIVFYGTLLISQWQSIKKNASINLPLPLMLFPFISLIILVFLWPWLWSDTLDHFLKTLTHWGGTISEQFLGHYGPAPTSYFFVHFLVGTPLAVLLLLVIGIWKIAKTKTLIGWAMLLWLVAPFGISFYHLRQDHLRYVLASYPAVALISALGFWWIVDVSRARSRWIAIFAFLLLTFYLLIVAWRINPYYLNYYNELVGGTKSVTARQLFDIGFYGEGIKEATEFINKSAPDGSYVHYEVIPDDAPYLDRPRLIRYDVARDVDKNFDYLIYNANALQNDKKRSAIERYQQNMEKVYSVKADGAEFVWVYKKTQNSNVKTQN